MGTEGQWPPADSPAPGEQPAASQPERAEPTAATQPAQPPEPAGASPRQGEPDSSSAPDNASEPDSVGEPSGPAEHTPAEDEPKRGSVSFQDPGTTVPREPTLAEQRARQQAAKQAEEAEAARWDALAAQAKRRKRMLVGGAVGVGLVAVIALAYSSHNDETEARCVGPDNVVVDDNNCVTPASNTAYGGYHGGGFFPIFIGSGGRQYHYTYGGSGGIGQVATGGTTVPPREGTVRTPSGRTFNAGSAPGASSSDSRSSGSSSVKRGGFGVKSHGSGGGSRGSSGS